MGKKTDKTFPNLRRQMQYYQSNRLGNRLKRVHLNQLDDRDADMKKLIEFVQNLYLNNGETITVEDIEFVIFDHLNDALNVAGNTELGYYEDTSFDDVYDSKEVVLNEFDFEVFKLDDRCRQMISDFRAVERVLLKHRIGNIVVEW